MACINTKLRKEVAFFFFYFARWLEQTLFSTKCLEGTTAIFGSKLLALLLSSAASEPSKKKKKR
jgi:hypothetical protein